MNKQELLNDRWERINKAIRLEKPDRTPVILLYTLFSARITGMSFPDFCKSVANSAKAMIEAFEMCGDADGVDYLGFPVYALSFLWLSKIKVPGIDLDPETAYQVAEAELMKVEDYDTILEKGWPAFLEEFIANRVYNDVDPALLPQNQPPFDAKTACDPYGIPVLTAGAPMPSPYELLCGGRSMTNFVHDLFTMPDKVQAVMDEIMPYIPDMNIDMTKQGGYPGIWVGGWRTASNMVSPRFWNRFVWPYYEKLVNKVYDAGLTPILHLDADWTRDLERLRDLPKGCIFAPDGMTDIFKAKKVLGDKMCIMGDVPAALFSVSSPDEVYKYCRKLITELGPEGFILHSGCDIPTNAKLENVKAMIAAAHD